MGLGVRRSKGPLVGMPCLWNAKLTETRIFRELSIKTESSLIELKSSLIQLKSSLIQLKSSLIQLESSLIQLESSLIQLLSSLYINIIRERTN